MNLALGWVTRWRTLLKTTNVTRLAHRGHWHNTCVENTIGAFNQSLADNTCDGIETDLRLTAKPHEWVVFHDNTMGRLSNVDKEIDATIPLQQNNVTAPMPTLIDLCKWVSQLPRSFIINIEIKESSTQKLDQLIEQLTAANKHQAGTIYLFIILSSCYQSHS